MHYKPKRNHRRFFKDDVGQIQKSGFQGLYSETLGKLSTADYMQARGMTVKVCTGRLQKISYYLEDFPGPDLNTPFTKGDLDYILNKMVPAQ